MELPVYYERLRPAGRKRVREEYVKLQGGKCWYCNNPLDGEPTDEVKAKQIDWMRFPRGFMKNKVHLQHDHYTGLTEGAVHALCNAVLWQYEGR